MWEVLVTLEREGGRDGCPDGPFFTSRSPYVVYYIGLIAFAYLVGVFEHQPCSRHWGYLW